jgi:membrane protein YqaA with SNARE-associated domain
MEYFILFLWSFLAATIIPGTSEIYLVALISKYNLLWIPVIIATIGNILGGITTYYLGWYSTDYLNKRKNTNNRFKINQSALKIIKKYGAFALILSWVPIIGDVIVGIAGVLKLPKKASFFWISIGKFLRYLLIGLSTLGIISLFN